MRDSIDPHNSTLLDRVMEIKKDVYEGKETSPEHFAIAWRVAESEEDFSVVELIKNEVNTPTLRFELAEKFFTEAKETEDELKEDGVELKPVPQDTSKYMLEGLLMGIAELKRNSKPEELSRRLSSVLDIVSRAAESILPGEKTSEEGYLGSTYLSKKDVKELCEQVNFIALFGFVSAMNIGANDRVGVFTEQKVTLNAINSVSERIVL